MKYHWKRVTVFLIMLLLVLSVPVFADGMDDDSAFSSIRGWNWGSRCGGGWFGRGMSFHPGGWIMFIGGLLLVGLIVFLIVKKGNIFTSERETPMDQLKRRYINGEISREEFLEKKEFLQSH